ALVASLKKLLPDSSRVLTVCHKDVEDIMRQHDTGFAQFSTAHWGDLDGKNDWADHDVGVYFGLPYRPTAWSANTFMALQGAQSTEWLQADGARPFAGYQDIRKALVVGQLVTDVVQGMGRPRCRKVIDTEGNCEPTTLCIALPNDETADSILAGIQQQM